MKHENNVSLRRSLIVKELFIYKHITPNGAFHSIFQNIKMISFSWFQCDDITS
ncbi:hypothetical protein PLCT1_01451 [Planctomycetaceae bacterium]|nr:hypothetical protein PLCT1_01451 [Planctomycetaceae bacterium]